MASASTANNLLLFRTERLTPGCRSFINCTCDFLVRDFATMLPKDRVVLEMLETIAPIGTASRQSPANGH
jgi:c-di-GMP-related signal transduction protein